MADDKWAHLKKVPVSDIEFEAMRAAEPNPDFTDPGEIAMAFITALGDPQEYQVALRSLTTPESHHLWGDFSEAAEGLAAIEDWGLGSVPTPALDDPNVVYAKVLSGVKENFQVQEEQLVFVAAMITLVWRPEVGHWLVHGFGQPIPADQVPRG